MKVVASSIFLVMHFLHQGKIFIIDQLDFCTPYLRTNAITNVSFFDDSLEVYASVSVSLFNDSSLLGKFPLPSIDATQVDPINMISSIAFSYSAYDMWGIPNPSVVESFGAAMSLSLAKLPYVVI